VDGGGAAELTIGGEDAAVRPKLLFGEVVIQPPTRMRGRGKGRDTCGVLRRENGDGRGKRGQRRQAVPFSKWHGGVAGERGGGLSGTAEHLEKGMGGSDRWAAARPIVARQRRARAAWSCLNRGAPGASDAWDPAHSGRERERERREAGRVGRPGEKGKWAEPEGT
jgi:hypothetical protein